MQVALLGVISVVFMCKMGWLALATSKLFLKKKEKQKRCLVFVLLGLEGSGRVKIDQVGGQSS